MTNHPHRSGPPVPHLLTLVDDGKFKLSVYETRGCFILDSRKADDSIVFVLNTEQAKMLRARIAKFLRENA